jgi:hypothetical protein
MNEIAKFIGLILETAGLIVAAGIMALFKED